MGSEQPGNHELHRDIRFGFTGQYVGIHFRINQNANTFNHLYVKNCYIHDVDGDPALHDSVIDKGSGGISMVVVATSTADLGHFNDVLLQNNTIKYVSRTGIEAAWSGWANQKPAYYSTNVVVKGNVFDHVAGDTLIFAQVSNGLAEGNVSTYGSDRGATGIYNAGLWSWSSNDIVYQKNEVAYIQIKAEICRRGISTFKTAIRSPIQLQSRQCRWFYANDG